MENENKTVETVETVENNAELYIKNLNDLKANSVDKKEYERVVAENKSLAAAILNGTDGSSTKVEPTPTKSISQMRKELFYPERELSNLEYCAKTLELRDALIADGQPDPFLPNGHQYVADINDIQEANAAAEALRKAVNDANGDKDVFRQILQSRMVDTAPIKPRRKN